jgi:hypothetical protein
MKKLCDRCGAVKKLTYTGGAGLCRTCKVDIQPEIESLRKAGKAVNVLQIARKFFKANYAGAPYMLRDVPKDLEEKWKERAVGDSCNQRDVVLAALVKYLK